MLPVTNKLSIENDPVIMLLPDNKGVSVIDITTIIRIQSISNYSKLYFANGKTIVVAKVLAWFANKLPGQFFLRVHRSHLIGLRYVQAYYRDHGSKIILHDNTVIDISRRKKKVVREAFKSLQAA